MSIPHAKILLSNRVASLQVGPGALPEFHLIPRQQRSVLLLKKTTTLEGGIYGILLNAKHEAVLHITTNRIIMRSENNAF